MIKAKLNFKEIQEQFLEEYIFDLDTSEKLPKRNKILKYFQGNSQKYAFRAFTDYILSLQEVEFLEILLEKLELISATTEAELYILRTEFENYSLDFKDTEDYSEYLETYLIKQKKLDEVETTSYILKNKIEYISALLESDSMKQ